MMAEIIDIGERLEGGEDVKTLRKRFTFIMTARLDEVGEIDEWERHWLDKAVGYLAENRRAQIDDGWLTACVHALGHSLCPEEGRSKDYPLSAPDLETIRRDLAAQVERNLAS